MAKLVPEAFRHRRACAMRLGLLALSACACADGQAEFGAPAIELDASAPGHISQPDARSPASGCRAPAGIATDPHTIADAVFLLNSLPRPLTVPCFVEALARPLALHAADSQFSAQPSEGRRSPRVFIFFDGLTLSVAPGGPSAHLLEFGEQRPNNLSLKAELEFPIDTLLDDTSPYERLPFSDGVTTCGLCHQGETQPPDAPSPYAVISPAIRTMPGQRVPLDELRAQSEACVPSEEPQRCALLHALFAGTPPPIEHEFPESYPTFF